MARPPFIVSARDVPEKAHVYPQSTEAMGASRKLGKAAGLQRMGVNLQRLAPGQRSSWPHAESDEEEFVYVLVGQVDAWIDGHLHPMQPGDLAAFPAGTGISHCFLNNGSDDVLLLVGGEAAKQHNRIYYPVNPSRKDDLAASEWWDDVPQHPQGPHDGVPKASPREHPIAAWHRLVRDRNPAGLDALLDDDAVFLSPVVHTPQQGKAITAKYLAAAFQVFFNPTFRYVRELVGATDAVLEFETTIDGLLVNGVDMIKWNAAGRIVEFKVMVRPLKAINFIHQRMAEMLQRGQ